MNGPGFTLKIADNGPGIPGHAAEKIFDPFFTTKEPDSGHGTEASRDEAMQSGAFVFLTKPFSLAGIKGLIDKIMASPRPT